MLGDDSNKGTSSWLNKILGIFVYLQTTRVKNIKCKILIILSKYIKINKNLKTEKYLLKKTLLIIW